MMYLNEIPDAFADQVVWGPSEESSRANIRLNDLLPSGLPEAFHRRSYRTTTGVLRELEQIWGFLPKPVAFACFWPSTSWGICSIGVELISHD